MKQGGPSAGEGRHGVGGGPFLRVPATAAAAGEPGRLGTQGGRGHGASPCSGGGSMGTPGCSAGGSARRPRAGGGGWRPRRGGWLVQPPRQHPKRHRGGEDAGQGGVHADRAGQPRRARWPATPPPGRPHGRGGGRGCRAAPTSGTSGQVPEASRPATWPTSHTNPPTTRTVPMATSSRVSLAWWCWSWAQARHWHSGRSGCIAATSLQLGEQGAVAGLRPARDLPQGPLPAATGDRGAATPAGSAATGGRTSSDGEVVEGLDRPAGRAASVGDRLERRAGAARLVTHHEFLSSWQREGFARGAGPGGVDALPGPPPARAGCGSREPRARAARPGQVQSRDRVGSSACFPHAPPARTGLLPALSCWLSMGRSTMLTLVAG